jgi:NADH-quinone oxidoreductase subunit G
VSGAPETATLTIDGVEVTVPKGTGVVEAAMHAGVEIPVFCYEPRLGPPVGACRMCLCEFEGMPKPIQAACTLQAADGMVVKTAQTSPEAAEAQEAVLEFILVNHPLDCPVCDKGGECPLQDLTFRYGPGNTRMEFPKRTFDKPIPISPAIALDRERCILCYRCTRFSEGVAEDGQLIARNRGAQSLIATFEDEAYRAHFSGNVIELCPVGALTSTQYRFEARPWEIQNVPTVCGLCSVGCNATATTREGKVKRVLSRNHPEIDQGWLCDKGRFAFSHLRAPDRVVDPARKTGLRRFEPLSWDDALDELERLARAAGPDVLLVLSGSETVEVAYALSKLVRQGFGSDAVILPEETSAALDAFRAPLSAIRDAQLVVVIGDEPVIERAPVVDLWLKAASRGGAEVVTIGPAGSVSRAPGQAAEVARELADPKNALGKRLRRAERGVVVWSGPGGHGGEELARLATALGFAEKPGCAAFSLPATPNGRAVADAWAAAGKEEAPAPVGRIGLLLLSGEEVVGDPRVRTLAEQANAVVAVSMFADPARGWVDLIVPGTSYLERDGTTVNLEGRLQRLRRAVVPPAPDELAWIAKLAERFGVELEPSAPGVFAEVSKHLFGGRAFGGVGEHAELPPRAEQPAAPGAARPAPPVQATSHGGPLRLVRYRPLFSGTAVERVPELQFQRPEPVIELSPEDARVRGIEPGDTVTVSFNGSSVALRAEIQRRLVDGAARAAVEHVPEEWGAVEVTKA